MRQAYHNAPVDAAGRPVDHRTGEPLRDTRADGARGWYVKWDPERHQWVAENPGEGRYHTGDLPAHGEPNSFGYDEHGNLLPYANHRPKLSLKTILEVWKRAKAQSPDGIVRVRDPHGNWVVIDWEPGQPRNGLWDMGHIESQPYKKLRHRYLNHEITPKQFLEEFQNPDFYQVEHPSVNRSHQNEIP